MKISKLFERLLYTGVYGTKPLHRVLVHLLNFREMSFRRRFCDQLSTDFDAVTSALWNSGFASLDLADDSVIEYCSKLYESLDFDKDEFAKSYLRQYYIDLAQHELVSDLVCSDCLIAPISKYLGAIPVLNSAAIWCSKGSGLQQAFSGSQLWHVDGDADKNVKVFIALNNSGPEIGALNVLSRQQTNVAWSALERHLGGFHKGLKVTDEIMNTVSEPRATTLNNKRGKMWLVDTCNVFHYGSRFSGTAGEQERRTLVLHFVPRVSKYLPNRSHAMSVSGIGDRRDLNQLVTGLYGAKLPLRVRQGRYNWV